MTDEITHGVTCPACGRETFAFERDCHRCGTNRWKYETESYRGMSFTAAETAGDSR